MRLVDQSDPAYEQTYQFIFELPGDQDSMVLEPKVRRLTSVLRDILREADGDAPARAKAAE